MQVSRTRRVAALATAAVAVTGVAVAAAPTASAAPKGSVTITNTLPRWLSKATKVSVTPNVTKPQTVRVYLSPNGGLAALQAKVAAVSNPTSAEYGQYLSVAQYDAAYEPTSAAVASVSSYLKSSGLTVSGVEAYHRYITASGSRAALDSAFGVTLGTYTHDGQTVTAPASAAVLPASVGSSVLTITGLDTTAQIKTHDDSTTPPPAAFVNALPCNQNYGNLLATYKADYKTKLPQFKGQTLPYVTCGYTGPEFRSAYEGDTALTGKGVTVAITDAYSWQLMQSDADQYTKGHGDGSYLPGQLTFHLPSTFTNQAECGPSGWSGEETLDVEAVHAMAPEANIRYYGSSSCFDDDFTDTLARVVQDDVAKLVTNSWSGDEGDESSATVAADEQGFLQGAMQGQSFLFSSGDDGDNLAATGLKQVGYPASDPYVTGAGGTSTGIAYGSTLFQTSWGTYSYALAGKSWNALGFNAGGGGGFSSLFNRPSYQNGVVPTGTSSGRGVPDVSMDADANTGMLVGQTQAFPDGSVHYSEYRLGGTSLASPLLAGFFALAVQSAGKGFGLLNPLLYAQKTTITDVTAPTSNYVGVVRVNNNNSVDASDGLSYFVRTFGHDSSLPTTNGWDSSTGLGVPNATFLSAVAAKKTSGSTGVKGTPSK